MECDAFYALEELFRLSISSESSFLAMLSHKMKESISAGQIEDLQDTLQIVEDHREFIKENLECVTAGGHPKWPKAPEKWRPKVVESQEQLQRDLTHLLNYAERLSGRCNEGIMMIMNDAMFRQSQLALSETRATLKLSVLVFFFAPIAVTTSIFSMDVKEISGGNLSIWIWAVTSFVALVVSFVFWKWEPLQWSRDTWIWIQTFWFT